MAGHVEVNRVGNLHIVNLGSEPFTNETAELCRAVGARNGVFVPTMVDCDTGRTSYGGCWGVEPGVGLVVRPAPTPPAGSAQIAPFHPVAAPYGPLIALNDATLRQLGPLPTLPAGTSYYDVAVGLKAYLRAVRINCVTTVQVVAKAMPCSIPSCANAHYVHRAYFAPECYDAIWRPTLFNGVADGVA